MPVAPIKYTNKIQVMITAKEILDKHLLKNGWTKEIKKEGNLYNTMVDAMEEAINFIPCCTELKADRKVMTFEEFKKELFREKDGVYQWKTETRNRWFTEEYVRGAYNL